MDPLEDIVHFDTPIILITLRCSDNKKIVISKDRLAEFKYFDDVPDISETELKHTRDDLLVMFSFAKERKVKEKKDITLLSKLLNYYCYDFPKDVQLIDCKNDINLIDPGSKAHLQKQIDHINSRSSGRIDWTVMTNTDFDRYMYTPLHSSIVHC